MTTILPAERRERSGKGPARQLRREHKIPAIVYGGHGEPMRIAMPLKEIKRELIPASAWQAPAGFKRESFGGR